MTSNSVWACCTETPGLSRPTTESVFPHRSVSSVIGNGTSISTFEPGEKTDEKSNDDGNTPTTSVGSLLSEMERPTTPASPPKRLCQKACVRSTAFLPFHLHSSAANPRPICGWTPNTSRKYCDTPTPLRRS